MNLLKLEPSTTTVVYDNEPRNKHTVERMFKSVDNGYNIVVWPKELKKKDINDMVLAGISGIQNFIDDHTYNGLTAYLKINEWKKI